MITTYLKSGSLYKITVYYKQDVTEFQNSNPKFSALQYFLLEARFSNSVVSFACYNQPNVGVSCQWSDFKYLQVIKIILNAKRCEVSDINDQNFSEI